MKSIAGLLFLFLAGAAANTFGQGSINWGNIFGTTVREPVYYCDGSLLSGSGYTLAIFLGSSSANVTANNSELDSAPFRTGTAAGFVFSRVAIDNSRVPGTTGVHVQFRAWDNRGGSVTSWWQVLTSGSGAFAGSSEVFTIGPLGGIAPDGTIHLPPQTTGIRSFRIGPLGGTVPCVPEPPLYAYIAVGTGILLVCRRR